MNSGAMVIRGRGLEPSPPFFSKRLQLLPQLCARCYIIHYKKYVYMQAYRMISLTML